MTYLPQPNSYWRSPRVWLADITPAVPRLQDGYRSRGKLETVSLTGGLRRLTNLLVRDSRIKLMFLTHTGPVLGTAEMLSPVSTTRQPFRFVVLEEDDQRRLRAVVQSFLDPGEQTWIEKYRAALAQRNPPQRKILRVILEAHTVLHFVWEAPST